MRKLLISLADLFKWIMELPKWGKVIVASGTIVAALSPFLSSIEEWLMPFVIKPPVLQAPFDVSRHYRPGGFLGEMRQLHRDQRCVLGKGAPRKRPRLQRSRQLLPDG